MPQQTSSTQNDFDLQAWLGEISADNSLSQEEVQSLGKILGNDKVQAKLRDQVLMRRDYSRKTQEVADQRRQLEADVNAVLEERADLARWKGSVDAQLKKAYSDLDSERTTTAQFRARMQTIAEQNGLDVNELIQGLPAATAATGSAAVASATNGGAGNGAGAGNATIDTSKFVSADDFSRFARTSPLLQAELYDLTTEHQELFGKPFKMEYTDGQGRKWTGTRALVVKAAENNARNPNAPLSLRQVWESDFQVNQKRDEQLRESIRNEERGKLDAEYKTKLSADMLNGGTPGRTTPLADRPKSVLFDDKRDHRTPAERDAAAASGSTGGSGDNGRTSEPPPSSAANREDRWQRAASHYVERRAQGVPLGQEAPPKTGAL